MVEVVSAVLACIAILLTQSLANFSHVQVVVITLIAFNSILIGAGILRKQSIQTLIWPMLISVIIIRSVVSMPPATLPQQAYLNKKVVVEGIVDQRPDSGTKSVKVTLTKTALVQGDTKTSWPGRIIATLPLYNNAQYGDLVKVSGKIIDLQKINPEYSAYLRHQHIYGQIQYANAQVLSHNHGSKLISLAISAQQSIENKVFKELPRDDAALLLGVVAGLPETMSDTYSNALKNTSTTHIIVASGYNLTILMTLVMKLSPYIGKRKAILLSFVPVICYILISGAQPSIIRAGVVAFIAAIGTILGRQKDSVALLAITSIIMLIYNPLWLYDTSFQLSFAATIGILIFQPSLNQNIKLPHWLRETASTTMAAQIGVMPIILGTLQSVSIIGLLVNILVLWIIPWIMAGGAILIALNSVLPIIANFAAIIVEPPLLYVRYSITFFGQLPFVVLHTGINILSITTYTLLIIWLLAHRVKPNETVA